MSPIRFRFFGRFVFAEPLRNGKSMGRLYALAMNLEYNCDIGAGAHSFLMSALHDVTETKSMPRGPRPGTRRPDLLALSSDDITSTPDDVERPVEYAIWNLRDYRVTIASEKPSSFQWSSSQRGSGRRRRSRRAGLTPVWADLRDLNDGSGTFDIKSLAGTGLMAPVNGLIEVTTGIGYTGQIDDQPVEFVTLGSHVTDSSKTMSVIDVVEIEVNAADDGLPVKVQNRCGGPAGTIVLNGGTAGKPTIVNFSNLCSGAHREFDAEFGGLYEVLSNPVSAPDRLVPHYKQSVTKGLRFDCFKPAHIYYEDTTAPTA